MTTQLPAALADLSFELHFDPLLPQGESLSFPCDKGGQVDLDELSDRARRDYMFAHTLIGRDFSVAVVPTHAGRSAHPELRPAVFAH